MASNRLGVHAMGLANHLRGLSEPRVAATLSPRKWLSLVVASGHFAQVRDEEVSEQRDRFDRARPGQAELGYWRALHNSLGLEARWKRAAQAKVTLFHKHLWNLPSSRVGSGRLEQDQTVQASTGRGRVLGLEVSGHFVHKDRWSAWLAYTLMKSERTPRQNEALALDVYDQRHLWTSVFSYRFDHGWTLGARFRLTTGNLYTPTRGTIRHFSASLPYDPIYGEPLSTRTPTFHQLDVRIDKTMTLRWVQLRFFLDLMNVYNQPNIEIFVAGYDEKINVPVYSLPILPAIGVTCDF